jgi:Tol biopolymer transport system component
VKPLGAIAAALVLAAPAAGGPGNGPILYLDVGPPLPATGHLYSIHADRSSQTLLTPNFRPVSPALSPDGTKIAFLLSDGGSPRDLYVMNSDGTAPRQLASYPQYENSGPGITELTWSANSTKLAYLLPQVAPAPEQLRIVDVNTGADVPVPPDSLPKAQLEWSPDGTEIAFSGGFGVDAKAGIFAKNLATGAVRTVVSEVPQAVDPRWSPDGRSIAYVQAGSVGVFVVSREGGAPLEVGRPALAQGYPSQPVWSPDGKRIYFNQAVSMGAPFAFGIPTTYTALFVANADGSGQQQLRPDITPLGWSPEGDALAVSGPHGVYFTRPDGKCLTWVAGGEFVGWRPGGNPPPASFECVDFVVAASAPASAPRAGVHYAITTRNMGTLPGNATLVQTFDVAVKPVNYGRGCAFASNTLRCALRRVRSGEERKFSVTVRPRSRHTVRSTITVDVSGRDSDPTSNSVTLHTRIRR